MNIKENKMHSKTIGVVLGSFEEACQSEILAGIADRLQNESVNLVIFIGATLEGYSAYNSSYTMLANLISSTHVDSLLLMGGAMSNLLSPQELTDFVQRFSHIPLLSISSQITDIPSLLVDNYSGLQEAVNHLIQVHGCNKLAFICGPEGHEEAHCRLSAYKTALISNGISVDPSLIIPGDFSRQAGEDAVKILIDERQITELNGFVCVDDYTAYGVLHALKTRGYSIPSDMYVTGFDDVEEAKSSIPQLTTVKQPFYEMGQKGASMILNALEGLPIPQTSFYPAKLIIRESCGCFSRLHTEPVYQPDCVPISLPYTTIEENIMYFLTEVNHDIQSSTLPHSIFYETIKEVVHEILHCSNVDSSDFWCHLRNMIYRCLDHHVGISFWEKLFPFVHDLYTTFVTTPIEPYRAKYFFTKLNTLLREIKSNCEQHQHTQQYLQNFSLREISQKLIACFDMDSILFTIEEGLQNLGIRQCYIGIYPENISQQHPLPLQPDELLLTFSYANGRRQSLDECSVFCGDKLLPQSLTTDTYLFMPLLFRSEHFGYIIFGYDLSTPPSVFETLRSHISSGLKGALLYQEQQHAQSKLQVTLKQLEFANSELHALSIRDELTSLFNRRGFMDLGLNLFQKACVDAYPFVLFYLDLDGLKLINDTYGHTEGDLALISISKILRNTFNNQALICRLGGDEFTVLAPHMSGSSVADIIGQLEKGTLDYNQTSRKPYILSTSIGYALYQPTTHTSFEELMSLADKNLYREKRLRHTRGLKIHKHN